MNLTDFLLARLAEDEAAARLCAEMFPSPWDVADRGWRVRIYAGDVPIEDLMSDEPGATATRNPVVMEVEPDRRIEDPRWLSERVEHVRRHDPARVLAEVEAKRRIVAMHADGDCDDQRFGPMEWELPEGRTPVTDGMVIASQRVLGCETLAHLAAVYADHPDYREEWRA